MVSGSATGRDKGNIADKDNKRGKDEEDKDKDKDVVGYANRIEGSETDNKGKKDKEITTVVAMDTTTHGADNAIDGAITMELTIPWTTSPMQLMTPWTMWCAVRHWGEQDGACNEALNIEIIHKNKSSFRRSTCNAFKN